MSSEHNCVEKMHWHLSLQHFGNTNIKYLEVRGQCSDCGKRASFRGPMGVSPDRPTVAIDGSEACFPFLIDGEIYDGRAIGYAVTIAGSN